MVFFYTRLTAARDCGYKYIVGLINITEFPLGIIEPELKKIKETDYEISETGLICHDYPKTTAVINDFVNNFKLDISYLRFSDFKKTVELY
jgi:hypothetical protein